MAPLQALGCMQAPVSILTVFLCPTTVPLCGRRTIPIHITDSIACPMLPVHLPM